MFFHPWHRTRGVGTGSCHQRTYQDRRTTQHFTSPGNWLKWFKMRKVGNAPDLHQIELKSSKIMYSVDNSPVIDKVIYIYKFYTVPKAILYFRLGSQGYFYTTWLGMAWTNCLLYVITDWHSPKGRERNPPPCSRHLGR
jgi:hypothetical protein